MRSMQYQRNIRNRPLAGYRGPSHDSLNMRSGSGCGCSNTRAGYGRNVSLTGQSCPWNKNDRYHGNLENTVDEHHFFEHEENTHGRASCSNASRSGYGKDSARQRLVSSVNEDCGCGCESSDNDGCAKLMRQLQTVDFALYEVILYLDAYPKDCEALNTYHMLLARRQKLASAYEESCGPLTAWGNVSTTSWDWIKGPSPWEYPKE